MSQEFDNNVLDLVKQKGFCPYEYMKDFEKFKEQLPNKDECQSSLIGEKVVTKMMNVFLKFGINLKWERWKITTSVPKMWCFDMFEKLINGSLKNYGLCPDHYLGAPALNWHSMLNMTTVELELISDADIYLFFKKVWEMEFLIFQEI